MPTIDYPFQFDYTYDEHGELFPRLPLGVSRSGHSGKPIDVDAHVDSGAGRIATMHPVQLLHPDLGIFELEVGFSSSQIRRNLLGRDFFNLAQIGFRERHSVFYVSRSPDLHRLRECPLCPQGTWG